MDEVSIRGREVVLRRQAKEHARESFDDVDASLREALQRLVKGRGGSTRVCVASEHARLFVLPWVAQLTSPERWRLLAQSRFEQLYGQPPDDWPVRVAEEIPPRPRLVVALPASLVRAVQEVLRPRRTSLTLLDALQGLLDREPGFDGCVAEISPHSACLLILRRGQLQRIRLRRYENPDEVGAAARSEWAAAASCDPASGTGATPMPTAALLGGDASAGARLCAALGGSRFLELA